MNETRPWPDNVNIGTGSRIQTIPCIITSSFDVALSLLNQSIVYFMCSCISRARVVWLSWKLLTVEQRNGIKYVTREGYLQEELLTELIPPGFLNHTIYVDINFLLFSPLCCCCFLLWRLVLKRLRWKSWTCVCWLYFEGFLWRSYGFRHATSLVTNTYAELNCIKPS